MSDLETVLFLVIPAVVGLLGVTGYIIVTRKGRGVVHQVPLRFWQRIFCATVFLVSLLTLACYAIALTRIHALETDLETVRSEATTAQRDQAQRAADLRTDLLEQATRNAHLELKVKLLTSALGNGVGSGSGRRTGSGTGSGSD